MKYQYLLFDLDGTLTYSHPGIYNCIRYALEKMRLPAPTDAQLRACVGPPLHASFEKVFGLSSEDAARAVALYRERYTKIGLFENEPLPYAKTILKNVKAAGYKTALATAKPKIFADRIAEKFGFTPYLDILGVATTDAYCGKEQVVGTTLSLFGADKEKCLMIGDREDDILGARAHGVKTAALTLGYAVEGEFERAKPDYLFDTLEELERFLLTFE